MNNQNTIKPGMTLDMKARFFAQHILSTKIQYIDPVGDIETGLLCAVSRVMFPGKTHFASTYWNGSKYDIDLSKNKVELILTPLSDITDEDAIEVAHNVGMINAFVSERDSEVVMVVDDSYYIGIYSIGVIVMYKGLGLNIKPYWSDTQKLYDKIRSKGYALPWLNYSVEDMVQAGWIKLKGGK